MQRDSMPSQPKSPYKSQGGLRRIFNAWGYSIDGLAAAFRHEAAFRQLVLLAAILIPLACILPVRGIERAALIASVIVSLIIELLNSAIEAAIDRISYDPHHLSKRAKDMGSAAQLLGLANIAVVWGLILFDLLSGRGL